MEDRPGWAVPAATVAALFGVATILSGGLALFGGAGARSAAGDAVPFVLAFNFVAGWFYLVGAIGLYLWRPWAGALAWLIALLTLAVYAAFGLAAATGTPFEPRTDFAMMLRFGFWLAIAILVRRAASRRTATPR